MRYTSAYGSGIESIDRDFKIHIGVFGSDKLTDEGVVFFVRKGTSIGDEEFICSCQAAVSRSVYELICCSIQDGQSVTGIQLYSAIKMLAKKASALWTEGQETPEIDKHF